jgi:hypothetical protein
MSTRAGLRRRLEALREAIEPAANRIRIDAPTAADLAAAPSAEVTVNPETGIVTYRSAGVARLLKEADERAKDWLGPGRYKSRTEVLTEEAKRLVDGVFKGTLEVIGGQS